MLPGPASFRPYVAADQVDRDSLTLRWVIEKRLAIVLECRNCRKVSAIDALEMIARFGSPSATLGMIRAKAVCERCKRRLPYVLVREPGMRGDKAWWPHPPLGRE